MSALRARTFLKLRDGRNSLDDAHGNAGAALVAGRAVGDRLAAAEAAMGQEVIEVAGLVADQMREHLALVPARQIGAGRRRRQIELRGITRVLGHVGSSRLRNRSTIALSGQVDTGRVKKTRKRKKS